MEIRYKNGVLWNVFVIFSLAGAAFLLIGLQAQIWPRTDLPPDERVPFFVYALIALMAVLPALPCGAIELLKSLRRAKLIARGKCYCAQVLSVCPDRTINMGGVANRWHPLRVTCQYTDAQGTKRIVTSPRIWREALEAAEICRAAVWLLPEKQHAYYVQLFSGAPPSHQKDENDGSNRGEGDKRGA